jgi:ammonium transporter
VAALIIGAVSGVIVVFSIIGLDKVKVDDPVGAISVHGVCGLFGLMVVPLSNTGATFGAQLLGAAVIFAWVFAASFLVWLVLKNTMGIRVTEEEEMSGMDLHDCGIDAYPEFVSVK